jgi:hypothetical protein
MIKHFACRYVCDSNRAMDVGCSDKIFCYFPQVARGGGGGGGALGLAMTATISFRMQHSQTLILFTSERFFEKSSLAVEIRALHLRIEISTFPLLWYQWPLKRSFSSLNKILSDRQGQDNRLKGVELPSETTVRVLCLMCAVSGCIFFAEVSHLLTD